MGFIKALIGIPLALVILVFAFVNNDMAVFNLWPTGIEITVSLSVAIIFLLILGYLIGWLFTWLSYAKVRQALRTHKKQNKKLAKEQEKLTKEVEDLHGSIENLKASLPEEEKPAWSERFKSAFVGKASAGGEKGE